MISSINMLIFLMKTNNCYDGVYFNQLHPNTII